ncbi:hypothetical protein F2P81_005317 [Scophthalmus maximus]|uniref:Uncharacterized protein n=1 Tax=Scophthalmus maximus TaxID=52904 RepID=A0A6A4T9A6_SCOMX|nr:hypothetical protein F2P81_005317 [Scophthalmus maximus]
MSRSCEQQQQQQQFRVFYLESHLRFIHIHNQRRTFTFSLQAAGWNISDLPPPLSCPVGRFFFFFFFLLPISLLHFYRFLFCNNAAGSPTQQQRRPAPFSIPIGSPAAARKRVRRSHWLSSCHELKGRILPLL